MFPLPMNMFWTIKLEDPPSRTACAHTRSSEYASGRSVRLSGSPREKVTNEPCNQNNATPAPFTTRFSSHIIERSPSRELENRPPTDHRRHGIAIPTPCPAFTTPFIGDPFTVRQGTPLNLYSDGKPVQTTSLFRWQACSDHALLFTETTHSHYVKSKLCWGYTILRLR